ncbi:phage tail protein [Leptolyngbya sp. FACHB-261]|uniref:phage tail protein n=1 Tax=Leptolyngbya sp. FACHB-261 TaxID=2692806 RepID=UPI001686E8BE|nr:tail fiber protein [Leptolyngbya sp. FACHB-261]MBD2099557.1 phage tail protein [Leptolyngbya sp. FACHB-261]
MSEPFIGEIRLFAGNFAPRGWAFCDGQLLPLAQSTALFSILGTTYGGNGKTTFALPDLRGRVPIHAGTGSGLSPYELGQAGGQEQVMLTVAELPTHSHDVSVNSKKANQLEPVGHILAEAERRKIYSTGNPDATMHSATIANTGHSQPHENRQPYLALHYIIALEGFFPPQP